MSIENSHDPNDAPLAEIAKTVGKQQYRSFTLRLEISKPNYLVTSCLTFDKQEMAESKWACQDYAEATLASFRCGIDMWLDFTRRMLNGRLILENGLEISGELSFIQNVKDLAMGTESAQPREYFIFASDQRSNLNSDQPLIAIGLPTYANLADASARYVHRLRALHNNIQFVNQLVIALPREPEIALAEWLPNLLRLRFAKNQLDNHQLDVLFWEHGGVIRAHSVASPLRDVEIAVPQHATSISGYLLDANGSLAQRFNLMAPFTFVGDAEGASSLEQQARSDIWSGESENRELKAFFNPKENTEMRLRVLHSAIAFANTSGGRIYVGVEDNGQLSGNRKLLHAARSITNATCNLKECAESLSRALRCLLTENTRPVILASCEEIRIGTEWIVRLNILKSREAVGTHANDYFVRSGASNRNPPAEWFARQGSESTPESSTFKAHW
jgi:hypothetical protein